MWTDEELIVLGVHKKSRTIFNFKEEYLWCECYKEDIGYILFVYSGASGLEVFFIRFFVVQGRKNTQGGGSESV